MLEQLRRESKLNTIHHFPKGVVKSIHQRNYSSFMGNKYVKSRQKSNSQRDAEHRKGDKFEARIGMDAADPHWNAAYQHTRTTPDPSLFLNPDTRRTSPSSYLQESGSSLHPARSGSSSMHTDDQGQAGPSRPPRVSSHHRGPVEQMEIIDDGQVYPRQLRGSSGYYEDIWAAGGAGSANGPRRTRTSGGHGHHSRQRSRKSSRSGRNDDGCCSVM